MSNALSNAFGKIVILGAGLAGLTVAESLRAEGYDGAITLVGAEAHAPYQRPPLSKGFLLGTTQAAQLVMRSPELLAKKGIHLKVDAGATVIDRAARRVTLSSGEILDYTGLAVCTGARLRPLPLPGAGSQGIFGLRSLDDARTLATALETAHHVVVIGGGFIGLEVAAAARKKSLDVTVLEAAPRLMSRVVAAQISQFYHDLHTAHGTHIVCNAVVTELVTQDGRIVAVRTQEGQEFAADLLIVGIGVIPDTAMAATAGIVCAANAGNAISVDACSRTSDPAIVAAGDCTARHMDDGTWRCLESVQNAMEQGKSAASALLGRNRPFTATPWFWSDQYNAKLQIAGLSGGFDQTVRRDTPGAAASFSLFYFRNGSLIAVDSINQPADHTAACRILDNNLPLTPAQVTDATLPLISGC